MVMAALLITCGGTDKTDQAPDSAFASTEKEKIMNQMSSYLAIFEIPAADIGRAISFYEGILELSIEKFEMPGMLMGVLPYEDQLVTGVIIQGEGYEPSPKGVTIYLNAGDDLQTILDRVEGHGGSILMPKTPHADESGYFALLLDSEGNRIGLNSPN